MAEAEWQYVEVRRYVAVLEHSLDQATEWAVFEPNDEALWTKVRQRVAGMLHDLFERDAFAGETPEDAYFVKCDRTTMTQDDVDNGRLVCVVGVAPVKPAEFVVVRLDQLLSSNDDDDDDG